MRKVAPLTSTDQQKYARLFIPNPKSGIDAFRWRISLVEAEEVFSGEELTLLLSKQGRDSLGQKRIKEVVKYSISKEIVLDEYERTLLFLTNLLIYADSLPLDWVIDLQPECSVGYTSNKSKLKEQLQQDPVALGKYRETLKRYGDCFLGREIKKIRAKIAMQEIVCALAPNSLVPVLVSLSTSYLGCEFVQVWLRKNQEQYLIGSKEEKEKAKENFSVLFKALKGDKRKIRSRTYEYWRLCWYFEDVSSQIRKFRLAKKRGDFDAASFRLFCEFKKIPKSLLRLVLDDNYAVKDLALEIMTDKKMIENPKAFRDFQPLVNRLQKKHFGENILLIADELIPIEIKFLDLLTIRPEITAGFDPAPILQLVQL